MKSVLITLLIALSMSCAAKQNTITNTLNNNEKTDTLSIISLEETTSSKLIFLNYMIEKTANGDKNIRFINKIIADGELKKTGNKYLEQGVSGDLKCYQLDQNSNIIDSVIIANPFIKLIEYVDDSKAFQKRKIELDKTQFSLRLQLDPKTKYIAISDIDGSKIELKHLIKTKIY